MSVHQRPILTSLTFLSLGIIQICLIFALAYPERSNHLRTIVLRWKKLTQTSTKMEKESKRKRRAKISLEEKMEIVKVHYLEGVSNSELARRYGTVQPVISRIIRNFAAENDKSALLMGKNAKISESEELEALRKENLELKKKLYQETMRADFYDTMVDVAEEMFNIEIRKKAGTGQLKGCTKTK